MNFLTNVSIKEKLVRVIMLTSAVSLLLACAVFAAYETFSYKAQIAREIQSMAKITAANSAAALEFSDSKTGRETLLALKEDDRILSAAVYNKQGKLFSHFQREANSNILTLQKPSFRGSFMESGVLTIYQPISLGGEEIGVLFIRAGLQAMYDQLTVFASTVGLILLVSLFVSYLLSSHFGALVSDPILQLTKTAEKVSEEKDYSIRAEKKSEDEVGVLIEQFNAMLEKIQQRDVELEQARDGLERRVKERTHELEIEAAVRQKSEQRVLWQNNILEMIAKNKPLPHTLETLISMIEAQVGRMICSINLLDDSGKRLKHGASIKLPKSFLKGTEDFAIGPNVGSCGRSAFANEMVIVDDIATDPLWKNFRDLALDNDLKACWSIPINSSRDKVLGTFAVYYKEPGRPTQTEFQLALSAAHLAGVAIEHKQADEQLREHARKLEESNQELQDFAFIASHDLQEPLRKVMAFGDRLKSVVGEGLGDKGGDYLDRIQNAALRMQRLIDDLLKLSRLTTKANPFKPVDLNKVVEGVLEDLEIRLKQSEGKVEVKNLPTVEADENQMRQLFQNLIANALKFCKEQSPPHIVIDCKDGKKGSFEISFQDNGIGFDPKYADRIFKPFERLHGRSEYEGTGMGLAICYKIVGRHGGHIKALGRAGEGATFLVQLPQSHN